MVGLGQNAYAVTLEGKLIRLNIDSGSLDWSFPITVSNGFRGPVLAGGRVFAGDVGGNVHALDARTGAVLWKKGLGGAISTSIAVLGSELYVGTLPGAIYRLRAEDGTVIAKLQLDPGPRGEPLLNGESLFVFFADNEENYHSLICIDLPLTRVRWLQPAPRAWAASRLLIRGDTVVVGTSAGDVRAFRLRDGSQAWRQVVQGRVRSIGGAGDVLYVGTQEGTLYAIIPPAEANVK